MHYLVLAVLILAIVYAGLRAFLNSNPKTMARNVRKMAGFGALLLAVFFTATGRFPFALPLGVIAISLLKGNLSSFNPFPGNANKSAGQRSRVRTRSVEMELDHDTGEMEGRIIRGKYASRALSSLDENEVVDLWNECLSADQPGAQLLEAYMDWRMPQWRDEAGEKANTSGASAHGPDGPMSREQACDILGIEPNASKLDIRRAHRKLMKRMHPDQGGSNYLAAKINQAKDLLLDQ